MIKKNVIPKNLLQPGMTLADRRYRVDELLGDNGLTISYKGYDTFRKKVVVVRELFPQIIMQRDLDHDYKIECKKLSDEELFGSMKEHMIQRAKKLIRLYPTEGISNVLTYLEERETVYVIEEYVEGQTLKELLWKRHSAKFLAEDLLKYLAPIMDTLIKLHANGLFHGAVYPENIRLTSRNEVFLVGLTNPMEDVCAPQLSGIAVRQDAYSPVELYVPEAKRGPSTDIYEVAAMFYHYVTGEPLPAYFERINEDKETQNPTEMLTRVMDFQSEAIMKGAAVYDFDRYETMQQLKDALCPKDIDYESLNSDMNVARTVTYRQQKKARSKYLFAVVAILVIAAAALGPGLVQVGKGVMIDHFYESFMKKDTAGQFDMLVELSQRQKDLYTNNYSAQDETLTDEERSKQAVTKYYDFQQGKYITQEKFDTNRNVYEYMKIDYWKSEIWITYISNFKDIQTTIDLVPNADGKYEVRTQSETTAGERTEEIIYVNYKK